MNLRPLERKILVFLAEKGRATKWQMMTWLYPSGSEPTWDILRVSVCNLRRKVKPLGIEIETVHGVGYRLPQDSRQKALECLTTV